MIPAILASAKEGGPILVRFITQVASRFGLVVTQKLAAQAIPLVGALGGATVNYAFIQHFWWTPSATREWFYGSLGRP